MTPNDKTIRTAAGHRSASEEFLLKIDNFDDFWPYYVRQHSASATRVLHAIGSVLALLCVVMAFVKSPWFLLAAPVVGYAFAWFSHFFVEHNKPATFGHPFYSLGADYRMLFLMLSGRMGREVQKHVTRDHA